MANVIGNIWAPSSRIMYWLDPWYVRPMTDIHATVWDGWTDIRSPEDARKKAKDAYRAHYKNVRNITPPERLLEFKLSDGWEPLCKFLGKPVPDVPFPHVNDTNWVNEKISIILSRIFSGLCGGRARWSCRLRSASLHSGIFGKTPPSIAKELDWKV